MTSEKKLQSALVYTTRSDLLDAVKQVLKACGFKADAIKVPTGISECMSELDNMPDGLLVIDWEAGIPDALRILSANVKSHKIEARPVYLIASQVDDKVVAAGAEYAASQINVGEISRDRIRAAVDAIIADLERAQPLREALIEVAKLRDADDWDAATLKLEQLRQSATDNLRLAAELAENYMHANQWDKAFQILENFRSQAAAYPRGLHLLGRCLMKLGKDEEAAIVLQQAKFINPYNVDRLLDLGNVLLSLDQVDEAEEQFDEALQFAPGSAAAKKGISKCKLLEGDINEALAILNEITSGHELASVFNTAAVISMRHGRYDDGMRLYESAVKAVQRHPLVLSRLYYNMGIGFHRWRRPVDALRCFSKAVELDPNYENAKFNVKALSAVSPAADASVAVSSRAQLPVVAPSTTIETIEPGNSGADSEDIIGMDSEITQLDEDAKTDFDQDLTGKASLNKVA